ncbi:MAG: PEP/pyruvate-binding domain-containing protein [Kiritimatiellia bacterium]
MFNSWNSERAEKYRQINKIQGLIGTAVNICTMVFGNMGDESGTGVAFTRDGSTGEAKPMGEYLINAQGEDVVAGIRTPKNLDDMPAEKSPVWRKAHEELCRIMAKLEKHYKYPQDVEFTVEQGKLWMLQTRNAKRTGLAGIRWAVEMATGIDVVTGKPLPKLLTPKTALMTLSGGDLDQLPFRSSTRWRVHTPICTGLAMVPAPRSARSSSALPRGGGGGQGKPQRQAASWCAPRPPRGRWRHVGGAGHPDPPGVRPPTRRSSRAGASCVCGASAAQIDYAAGITIAGVTYKKGDWISLNGSTRNVYAGQIPTEVSPIAAACTRPPPASTSSTRCTRRCPTGPAWCATSRSAPSRLAGRRAGGPRLGAEGIGSRRTEHMFFEGERIYAIRASSSRRPRPSAKSPSTSSAPARGLRRHLPGMAGPPGFTIRLLDPPLHEFVPHTLEAQQETAKPWRVGREDPEARQAAPRSQPDAVHRGCRLGDLS